MDTEFTWNPWHGCRKISPGCEHCYVYRIDAGHGKDSFEVHKNADFDLPVRKGRNGYKIPPGSTVFTCFSSDFLLDRADEWRADAWRFMKEREDLQFLFITKRIDRFSACLPPDWGDGYENVTVGCTCENQKMAEYRIPIFACAPIRHKFLAIEPMLEAINLDGLFHRDSGIERVSVGGESGPDARVCDYAWVVAVRDFCAREGIGFDFYQTGAKFRKDGRIFTIPRKFQHSQARKANIDLP